MNSPRPEDETRIRWRRLSISREGFSFLFVLMFILIGALVRQVNLLFVLAGLLIAAFLVNWRYAMASIRNVSVRRKSSSLVHAGQAVTVEYEASNEHRWLTCWSLMIVDRIKKTCDPQTEFAATNSVATTNKRRWLRSGTQKATTNIQKILPSAKASTSCRFLIEQRGEYELGPLNISTRFPLGLIRAYGNLRQIDQLTVAPRLGQLSQAWVARVFGVIGEGQQSSRHQSPHATGDFYSIRSWRSGDSRRAIDWRSTAKSGNLEVRQFDELRHNRLSIILDFWQPVDAGQREIAATELAASVFATLIAYASKLDCGKVCITIASGDLAVHEGRITQKRRLEIMASLASLVPAPDIDIAAAFENAAIRADARRLTLVVSTREMAASHWATDRRDMHWMNVAADEVSDYFAT